MLVSIIIPTYNRANTVSKAIDSCLRQSHNELEILVVDDKSSDETAQVVGSYKDPRVKYILHKINVGIAATWNTGLRNATGDYITFLDDDDEFLPEKISRQLEIFKNNDQEIGLVFTNGWDEERNKFIIDEKLKSGILARPSGDSFFTIQDYISRPSSWMFPKAVIDKIGYFDVSFLNNWVDIDYLARLFLNYSAYFLNENLVIWHASPGHVGMISNGLIVSRENFLKKYYGRISKDKEYLFRFYRSLGKDAMAVDKRKARKYFLKALLMRPLHFSTLIRLIKSF